MRTGRSRCRVTAMCSSHMQPPHATTTCNRHMQPPHVTAICNRYVQPPCITAVCNRGSIILAAQLPRARTPHVLQACTLLMVVALAGAVSIDFRLAPGRHVADAAGSPGASARGCWDAAGCIGSRKKELPKKGLPLV